MADTQNEVSETLVIPTVSTNESVADGSGEDVKVPECPNCNADYKEVIDQIKEEFETRDAAIVKSKKQYLDTVLTMLKFDKLYRQQNSTLEETKQELLTSQQETSGLKNELNFLRQQNQLLQKESRHQFKQAWAHEQIYFSFGPFSF